VEYHLMHSKDRIDLGNLKLECWHDIRRQETKLYAIEKDYYWKLTRLERPTDCNIEEDINLITLPEYGETGIKNILQKIVDFAFYYFQILPSRFKLESDMQKKHLEDMRAIVSKELEVDLPK
jgi:hypothetical protein